MIPGGCPIFAPGRFFRVERGAFEFAFEFAGCRRFRFPEPAGFRQIYRASFRSLEFAFSFIFDLVLRRLRARSIPAAQVAHVRARAIFRGRTWSLPAAGMALHFGARFHDRPVEQAFSLFRFCAAAYFLCLRRRPPDRHLFRWRYHL